MSDDASDTDDRLDPEETYDLLRELSSPLVAITTRRGDATNGMIANSAIRASIVPGRQRVANYVFKSRLTHEHLAATGRYALHLLARDQWDVIRALGFESGREREKLREVEHGLTETWELPVVEGCVAWMRCRVANVMDAGASTFFMGDVLEAGRGSGEEVMDSDWFRANAPDAWEEPYRENLRRTQEEARRWEGELDDRPWRRLRDSSGGGEGSPPGA